MSAKKILAIVISYYPEKDLLVSNINSFIDYVDKVIIWENTPFEERLKYRFYNHENVEYCGDELNSISHALNYGWRYAKDNHYDYLLTMDQDSQWGDGFGRYLECTVLDPDAPIGLWGPVVNNFNKGIADYEETENLITSGMLMPIDIVDRIGGWNEFFTIDSVDTEFCLRAWSKGIPVYQINKCNLNQRFGLPKLASFMGHKVDLRNDSPLRLYNIYRNFLILSRLFPKRKTFREKFYKGWIRRIKWILLFEDNRVKKISAIVRGLCSGLFVNLQDVRKN